MTHGLIESLEFFLAAILSPWKNRTLFLIPKWRVSRVRMTVFAVITQSAWRKKKEKLRSSWHISPAFVVLEIRWDRVVSSHTCSTWASSQCRSFVLNTFEYFLWIAGYCKVDCMIPLQHPHRLLLAFQFLTGIELRPSQFTRSKVWYVFVACLKASAAFELQYFDLEVWLFDQYC